MRKFYETFEKEEIGTAYSEEKLINKYDIRLWGWRKSHFYSEDKKIEYLYQRLDNYQSFAINVTNKEITGIHPVQM